MRLDSLLGKHILGSALFCCCAVSVFRGVRGNVFLSFRILTGFRCKTPTCSNKGSSGHDQSKTVGTEERLHDREVPSEFRHVPGWVAAGQGLQFWI